MKAKKNIRGRVVIGANFGDEGKGLLVDYLADSLKDGIVIRFNGGAQAGHTVTTPDGLRCVFSHVGAGTMAGLPTFLSAHFVAHPMLFVKEALRLKRLGVTPRVYIDGDCMVTTPYDVMINQIIEINRGSAKHGSCGVGFNETITRSLIGNRYRLSVKDLIDEKTVREKLRTIQRDYVPFRLAQLGVAAIPGQFGDLLQNGTIVESYLADVQTMLKTVELADLNILHSYGSLLFEGAQGLLLDQSHPYFPHVTRSNTGMKNVVEIIRRTGLDHETLEIIYVTRAYLTRHGAGPFPTELPEKPYPRIEDLTNVPNPFQDALRYGLLDLDMLYQTIFQDLQNAKGLNYNVKLAMTCMDQLDAAVDFVDKSQKHKTSAGVLFRKALANLYITEGYWCYGPSRQTVTPI